MRKSLTIIYLLFCLFAHAQDTPRYSIKAYLNYSWENKHESRNLTGFQSTQNYDKNAHNLKRPTLAMIFFKEDGFHEFELIDLHIRKQVSINDYTINGSAFNTTSKVYVSNFFARYEFAFKIFKKKARQVNPYLGLSVLPNYQSQLMVSESSRSEALSKYRQVGVIFSVVPRLTINLKKRFYIDINTPVDYLNINAIFTKDTGYWVDSGYKSFRIVEQRGFPNIINARLGFGVKF